MSNPRLEGAAGFGFRRRRLLCYLIMVFYFKALPALGDYTIFMGLDKHENEDLIKYGFPEDIWFHVDKMSSAHVYLRLHKCQTIDDISEGLLDDCAQLVKANSIQGNKLNNIDVVYTPWLNLKKTASMDVGQVGFHNSKMVSSYFLHSYCDCVAFKLKSNTNVASEEK